ncbi:MAG: hypothetical protein HQM13_02660 [SAR324 cluster bacterium]|nr:hypothetical protein [SAR324 cluster bacterium]
MRAESSQKSGFLKIILIGTFILMYGCYSPHLTYEWGWTTREIKGRMLVKEGDFPGNKGFILVRSYYSQFVELEDGHPSYFPQARLFFPQKGGNFTIPFDLNAAKIDLTFIVPGFVMHSLSFRRQTGVGNLSYEIPLQKTAGWQDHLFVTISPFLQQFILDQRFQLAKAHQMYLGDWLSTEKSKNFPGAVKKGT